MLNILSTPTAPTIIIPTRTLSLLRQCVASLRSSYQSKIVVVDTGSGECAEWARAEDCLAISAPGANYAEANNRAAKDYPGTHYILLNDDVLAGYELIPHLLAISETFPAPPGAVVGTRLLYPDGLVQHAGIGFDTDCNPYNLWRLAPKAHPEVTKARYLNAVTFACVCISKNLWDRLGGLDEGYHNSYEDVDFCLRAKESGAPIYYDSAATAVHLEGQTKGRYNPEGGQSAWQHFHSVWIETRRIYYVLGVWPFSLGGR